VSPDELVPLAWLAGRTLELDDDELRGPLRRALLLLAAGGDPTREDGLALDGRAVTALAEELYTPARVERVTTALCELGADVAPELAWSAFACSLLAEELADDS
jgi:hypothetical protein